MGRREDILEVRKRASRRKVWEPLLYPNVCVKGRLHEMFLFASGKLHSLANSLMKASE